MPTTRSDLARAFVPNSPFAQRLGLTIERLDAEGAELRMPFDPDLATVGDTVHGGAIASLIDTAAVTAAWGDDSPAEGLGGATVSMSVDYVAAARATDVVARARVVRRGRSLCFVTVEALDDGGRVVATGQVCHRYA
jgi:uncharacterized protein (TIGR00369 family)